MYSSEHLYNYVCLWYVYNGDLEVEVETVIEIGYVSVKALIISTYNISNTHPTHTPYR